LIGLQKEVISFSRTDFHKTETTLMSSRNATMTDFEHVISSMQKDLFYPLTYITHRVHFDQLKEEFSTWLDPKNGVIKGMVFLD
jgi:threonine dehydrogenase-like Zn-dependent dehydrogenase